MKFLEKPLLCLYTKCVMATGGAAMGSAMATGGLRWVVSRGNLNVCAG